jgi:hypothetical protein
MKQKIKAKTHGITRLGLSNWSDSEKQAINEIAGAFEFRENFNLSEQVLRASHSIKYISAMMQSNPNTDQKREYIQEIALTLNYLMILLSIGKMGSSIKDELAPQIEVEFDDLTDILHGLNASLFKVLQNLDKSQNKEIEQNSESPELPTKAQLKKMAIEYLCRVFLIGSSLKPTVTSDPIQNSYGGNLFNFIIQIKPFFEAKTGIRLGAPNSIGKNLFEIRKNELQNLKKVKVKN